MNEKYKGLIKLIEDRNSECGNVATCRSCILNQKSVIANTNLTICDLLDEIELIVGE